MLLPRLFSIAGLIAGCALPLSAGALEALNDEELSETSGQAAIALNEFNDVPQNDGTTLDFTRLTIGGVLEMNANIERVTLGRYDREALGPEWSCTDNNGGGCGGNPRDFVTGEAYPAGGSGTSFRNLPGGTHYTEDVDAQLRNLSMGQVLTAEDGTEYLVPMVAEDPYIEFAWQEINGKKELVGLRIGQKNTIGVMGNTIDVISGNVEPLVSILPVEGIGQSFGVAGSALLNLSGTRTPGYVDGNAQLVGTLEKGLFGANPDPDGEGPLESIFIDELNNQTVAQLRPNELIMIDNANDYFIGIGGRTITYPEITPGAGTVTMAPGFGINMAFDPNTGTGAKAFTELYQHPDNSFTGNPITEPFSQYQREY